MQKRYTVRIKRGQRYCGYGEGNTVDVTEPIALVLFKSGVAEPHDDEGKRLAKMGTKSIDAKRVAVKG